MHESGEIAAGPWQGAPAGEDRAHLHALGPCRHGAEPAAPIIQRVFAELLPLRRWVAWKWDVRKGKRTKVPVTADAGYPWAKSDDATTWRPFAAVAQALGN